MRRLTLATLFPTWRIVAVIDSSGTNAAPRLVLDTHVCLDLFVFDDPRVQGLRQALFAQRLQAITDEACRGEWLRVLAYPQLRLSVERQAQARTDYDRWLQPLPWRAAPQPLPRCRDPDDQMLLELAQAGTAAGLLSRDREVLRLAGRCRRGAGFRILPPEQWQALLSPDAVGPPPAG